MSKEEKLNLEDLFAYGEPEPAEPKQFVEGQEVEPAAEIVVEEAVEEEAPKEFVYDAEADSLWRSKAWFRPDGKCARIRMKPEEIPAGNFKLALGMLSKALEPGGKLLLPKAFEDALKQFALKFGLKESGKEGKYILFIK